MNIGDKVRLIHSKEEGIVTRFLKDNVVEVEIEAGFKLPILKRELAVVSKTETAVFKPQQLPKEEPIERRKMGEVKAVKGIFFAFVPLNEQQFSLKIINNSDWDLPFSITTGIDKNHRGLLGGLLKSRSFQEISSPFDLKSFDDWCQFSFQAIYFNIGFFTEQVLFQKRLRLRANTFFNHKKIAPIINKEAYLFQLDAEDLPLSINPTELKEKMLEVKTGEKNPEIDLLKSFKKPSAIIDLHIEELVNDKQSMNNAQILSLQIQTFERNFEDAIASGMNEITFIHGVGNGVLKQEIQRKLAGNKSVAWYEDAQKEKFGYGATKIKIK